MIDSSFRRRVKHVAGAADVADEAGGRGAVDFAAEVLDVDFQGVGAGRGAEREALGENGRGKDLAGVAQEEFQQVEFRPGEGERLAGAPDFARPTSLLKPDLTLLVEGVDGSGATVISRTAKTPIPIQTPEQRLLRVKLTSLCMTVPVMGAPAGPMCTAVDQTCIAGRCQDNHLLPSDLEIYQPTWATDVPDICRPASPGTAEVIVGTGQTDYLPLIAGQVVQAERGPQGGHHLYIALRQKNLHRSGSTTTITGRRPDTGVDIPPTAFVFTFDADEGGYCKLYGLRYQLDNGGIDYTQFLDHDLDLTVTVRDSSGTVGKGTVRVHVSPTVL